MRSLKWKLVLIYVALVFIVMIISGTFIVIQISNMETDQIKEQLEIHADMIYDQVIVGSAPTAFSESLTGLTRSKSLSADIQSSILNEEGLTIATNAAQGNLLPIYNNSAVIAAMAGNERFDKGVWTDATGIRKEWLNLAKPCEYNQTKYIIYVQTDIGSVNAKTARTTQIILTSAALALMFTIVVGIIFADTITRPIIQLTQKAKELARGRLNVRVSVESHDEIGQLSKNFNYMSHELSDSMSAISSEKNKLETLLHNMTDGVLAFNQAGTLIHANATSQQMMGAIQDKISLEELKHTFGLDISTDELIHRGESIESSASVKKRYIKASFAPYADVKGRAEGIVVVLQDLTEQKALDDMRKDFVANVSHEIRTPLTTIKSYSETLIDGALDDKETAREFLSTIDSETDRMALLVKDLLELSSLDNSKFVMSYDDVNLAALVTENIKQCKVLADGKKQKILYRPPEGEVLVSTDKPRATQVITNILSNAIKYSPEATVIKLSILETKNYAAVSIADQGMGIPADDLPRVFERFYRVDKARSRSMGGTGLGLAIAKEIMESMGGFIKAESEVSKGTRMTVYFPKSRIPKGEEDSESVS